MVTPLEQRLRRVEGVADLELVLGESGVESIKVKLVPGFDEEEVLERIRHLLAAYGLRARGLVGGPRRVEERSEFQRPALPEQIDLEPGHDSVQVSATNGVRTARRIAPASPEGVVEAVTGVLADLRAVRQPSVIGLRLDKVAGWRVLTVVLRTNGDPPMAGAAVVLWGLTDAVHRAVLAAMGEPR